jgi:hypothetical protein
MRARLAVALLLASTGSLAAAPMVTAAPLPGTTCTLFPADSVFNADISSLPVNAQSATWTGNMTQHANIHPDLGTLAQLYGIPTNVAPPPTSGVAPAFLYNSESDHPAEGYPIDQNTLIEGGPGAPATSDRHALVVNRSTCKLYEIYNLQNFTNGQQPQAGSGAVWDLGSDAMRPDGWTSADAAGLPITPLLLRPDEILAGSITHAIRFTTHCTHGYIWPGSHDAGLCDASFPPMGARFRLRASFDISGYSPDTQVVLRAFQHHGLILADNGSDWYVQGTSDDWWGTAAGSTVVNELKTIPAAQFDAVDESSLQAAAGSYRAAGSAHALPQDRLNFGLANGPADLGWMTSTGVPWRYRYVYLAGGVNTPNPWQNWNSPTGAYATNYMNASAADGYIPVFTYYELLQSNPSTGANESDRDFSNLNNPTTMAAYYANFKLLMQTVGAYAKPVVVHVEPDLWGYLQQRAAGGVASTLSASVGSSGFADVAGIPDTAQGFAQALLRLRDLYGSNAIMAIHASGWASGIDIDSTTDPTVNAGAVADSTAAFLNSAGLSGNPFGSTWDLVFNDLDDHDAGWWERQGANNAGFTHWWDPTNTTFPNFARYLAWVTELRTKTGVPQVAWQVPVGNQYFLTMNNTCGHYQDNVAQYFTSHPDALFGAGIIAVLFGAGNACQTTYTDAQGDGITNNGGATTTDTAGRCNACNTHTSSVSDDDGGFLRMAVGQYYGVAGCTGTPLFTSYFSWFDKATAGMVGDNIHLLNTGGSTSAGCVRLGAQTVAFSLAPGQETYVSFPHGTIGGPVTVSVTSGPAVLASQRVQYFQSFNEVWAMSPSQAATTSYLSWFDKATAGMVADNIHVLNPGATGASVAVSLPGASPIAFALAAGAETYVSFPRGTIGGPVKVTSDQPVLASQRVQYYQTFNEVVARSAAQATTTSYFNWFDKATPGMVGDNIHLLNTGSGSANINVSLPGASSIVFTLPSGAETYVSFTRGHIGGPVTVSSDQPVLASQRVQYYQSFNETPSESAAQAQTTSHIMWFDKATPGMVGDNVHVLNTSGTSTNVTVSLPGASPVVFTLGAGQETYVSFPSGNIGGPVTITSSQPVLAAQRVQYFQTFNEVPAA